MKQFYHIIVIFLIFIGIIISLNSFGRVLTSVQDGDWTDDDTWDISDKPEDGDTIIISAIHTVQVTSNETYAGDPMIITINGTLEFVGGGSKLNLPDNSKVLVSVGGLVTTSGGGGPNSQTLKIGTEVVWEKGDGPVPGPMLWPILPLAENDIYLEAHHTGNSVSLNINLEGTFNYSRIEVLKSYDGQEFFPIDVIDLANYEGTTIEYSDNRETTGAAYYRIDLYDNNESIAASETIYVENTIDYSNIFVNQNNKELIINIQEEGGNEAVVKIFNLNGQSVAGTTENFNGDLDSVINLQNAKSGMYIVNVFVNNQVYPITKKVFLN